MMAKRSSIETTISENANVVITASVVVIRHDNLVSHDFPSDRRRSRADSNEVAAHTSPSSDRCAIKLRNILANTH
jgi:hypothetical protein